MVIYFHALRGYVTNEILIVYLHQFLVSYEGEFPKVKKILILSTASKGCLVGEEKIFEASEQKTRFMYEAFL